MVFHCSIENKQGIASILQGNCWKFLLIFFPSDFGTVHRHTVPIQHRLHACSPCLVTETGAKVVHHQNSTPFQKLTARLHKKVMLFPAFLHLSSGVIGEQKSFLRFGRCFFYSKREKDSWSPKMRILPNPNFPRPPLETVSSRKS